VDRLYTTIIWPLLQVRHTALILISSPKTASHYVSNLMRKINPINGEFIFHLCSVSSACAACLRAGKREEECEHQMAGVPDHLTSVDGAMLATLYDDEGMGEQELKGLPTSNEERVFKGYLERWHQQCLREPYRIEHATQTIVTFMDPSGGGASNATIASHTRSSDGVNVIIGFDICARDESKPPVLDDQHRMAKRHFASIRRDRRYAGALIFVAIEVGGSPAFANSVGQDILASCGPGIYIVRGQVGEPTWYGVVTNEQEKKKWANHTVSLLASDLLRVAPDLIGADVYEKLLPQLVEEMGRYSRRRIKVNEGKDNETTKEVYSGKAGGKQDDLCTAVIASLWQAVVLRQNPHNEFHRVVRQRGLLFT